jgi:pimeloyl-ACP methyl ester carboxylesterase
MAQRTLRERVLKGTDVPYYLYAPDGAGRGVPVFVTVHGWSRNVLEHANGFLPYARAYRVVLLAPLFERGAFPQYQRLGHSPRKGRADHALDAIISEVGAETGATTRTLFLFGFSGGGQFVQRYAMACPERVSRVALGAPGWFTFPDPSQPFPRGLGPSKRLPDIRFEPSRFLKVPAKVMVGDHDVHRNHHLNTSSVIDETQGTNRLERATHWVHSMNAAARACNFKTKYILELLPDSDHSFTRCMEKGGMGDRVFTYLFGRRP